ncbi:hypothetical protein PFISCL1PPCAC_21267, partial [Pristionchus fissidentatus]
MNVVLGAAVVTNFGSDTNNQLGILLETIDRLQLAMIKGCENLSLLYFSRSFAVVVEEAARQKEEIKCYFVQRKVLRSGESRVKWQSTATATAAAATSRRSCSTCSRIAFRGAAVPAILRVFRVYFLAPRRTSISTTRQRLRLVR